jgi:hypothetical protein
METNNKNSNVPMVQQKANEAILLEIRKNEANVNTVATVFSNDETPNLKGNVGISVKVKNNTVLIVLDDKKQTELYARRMLKNNLAVKMRFKTLGGLPVIKMNEFIIGQSASQGIRLPKVDESLLNTIDFNKSYKSYSSAENVAMVKRQLDILLSLESENTEIETTTTKVD